MSTAPPTSHDQQVASIDGLLASRVQMHPATVETRLLVESRQQKLDDGFAPRALNATDDRERTDAAPLLLKKRWLTYEKRVVPPLAQAV